MDILLFPGYFLIIPILIFIIPGIIFYYLLKKESIEVKVVKSIWEVSVAKLTCMIIGLFIATLIQTIILLIIKSFIDISNITGILEIIFILLSTGIYYFFYYKFLLTTCNIISYDEEINKKIVKKFIFFSEIISSIIGIIYVYLLGIKLLEWL